MRLLIKTKYQPVKQLLMNYQTVVDELTSRRPPLLSPSPSLDVERRTQKDHTRVRGQNIEDMMEKSGIKSGRGQITRLAGGMRRARREGEQKSAAWRDRFQTYWHDLGERLIRKLKTAKIQTDDK